MVERKVLAIFMLILIPACAKEDDPPEVKTARGRSC